jgi:hypothetical protein
MCKQRPSTHSMEAHLQLPQVVPCTYEVRSFSCSFAEFCFLCPEGHWSTNQDNWKRHCESHLANLDTLPYQCDPLIYTNTLAAPGLCFWCFGNENLPPTLRLQRFLDKASWQSHIEKEHLAESTDCKSSWKPARIQGALARSRS